MAPGPSKSGHTAGDLVAGSWASTEEPTPYPFTDLRSVQCSSVPRPSLPPCLIASSMQIQTGRQKA